MPQTPYSTQVPVSYLHVSNAGTTEGKQAAGALLSMNVNSATGAGTVILYDQIGATPGTVEIASFAIGTADILPLQLPIGPTGAGLKFNTGLLVVTTGTLDATFGYR
jgi:hypothetical protein